MLAINARAAWLEWGDAQTPRPSAEQLDAWVQEYFHSPQLMVFQDRASLAALLDARPLDPALRQQLLAGWRSSDDWRGEVFERAEIFVRNGDTSNGRKPLPRAGGALVSRELMDSLPALTVRDLVATQIQMENDLAIAVPDPRPLIESWRAQGVDAQKIQSLLAQFFRYEDRVYVMPNERIWPYLPQEMRRQFIAETFLDSPATRGFRPVLQFDAAEDLNFWSQRFAALRDPQELGQQLVAQRDAWELAHPGEAFRIELSEILPAPMRNALNGNFAPCPGANCFAAAGNVARGLPIDGHFLSSSELVGQLSQSHRLVGVGAELKPGDVIVLRDLEGRVRHAMVSLGDDLVFTKNASFVQVPYLIQRLSDVSRMYAVDAEGPVQAIVARAVQPGELPMGPGGFLLGAPHHITFLPTWVRVEVGCAAHLVF